VEHLYEAIELALGTAAEYERAASRGTWTPVTVLISREPPALELGEVRSTTPVLVIEIRRASISWTPARGDRLRWAGTTWLIDEPPVLDRLGLAWRLYCYREAA
jgi:hypothetical protein